MFMNVVSVAQKAENLNIVYESECGLSGSIGRASQQYL